MTTKNVDRASLYYLSFVSLPHLRHKIMAAFDFLFVAITIIAQQGCVEETLWVKVFKYYFLLWLPLLPFQAQLWPFTFR